MPTPKICGERHKVGSQEYKDCLAYKKTEGKTKTKNHAIGKVKVKRGY